MLQNHRLRNPSAPSSWSMASAIAALLLLGAAGYILYLHAGLILEHGHTPPPLLLLLLALIGGAASFFSPCSIVMTPAFLAWLTFGTPESGNSRTVPRPQLRSALLVAFGIVLFYAIAGMVIGAVGNVVYNYLIYFIPVVGVAFLLLAVVMLFERGAGLAFLARWNPLKRFYEHQEDGMIASRPRGNGALITFGFAYGAASHSCSLPIFLGILLIPLVAGSYLLAALSVVLYGLALAFLLVVMMFLGHRVFSALRRIGPWLTRVTAILFLGTSMFLFAYFGQNLGAYRNAASGIQAASNSGPSYSLIVGADATGYPYQPRVLIVPVQKTFRVVITDHVGGCLLSTVFENLAPHGGNAEIVVPVGKTRTISLYAARPGRYIFHCGENMYSGLLIAR